MSDALTLTRRMSKGDSVKNKATFPIVLLFVGHSVWYVSRSRRGSRKTARITETISKRYNYFLSDQLSSRENRQKDSRSLARLKGWLVDNRWTWSIGESSSERGTIKWRFDSSSWPSRNRVYIHASPYVHTANCEIGSARN